MRERRERGGREREGKRTRRDLGRGERERQRDSDLTLKKDSGFGNAKEAGRKLMFRAYDSI